MFMDDVCGSAISAFFRSPEIQSIAVMIGTQTTIHSLSLGTAPGKCVA